MNIGQIEDNIQKLVMNPSKETFIYDLLLAYNLPKASITRLKDGAYNLSKDKIGQEIIWKKRLFFKEVFDQDLHAFIDNLHRDEESMKHNPRFIIITDYKTLLAYDTKTKDTLDIELANLPKHFDFFLPWAGMEKAQAKLENPADVKAAEKMAKLYDLIRQDNPDQFTDKETLHCLNIFLSRLLFCYFAEDTEIFPDGLFTSNIISHTQEDGSDLDTYLDRLFAALDDNKRKDLPKYLEAFPYVNGGLFAEHYASPKFSARSRKMLIECGRDLDWSDINPDIFGSMIQAVVHPDQRGGMGMHYTSVTNIMKVIEPLFLNDLHEEFEKNTYNPQKLDKLLARLSTIRIFDPACGSGNFLIIAYKELRKLEIAILQHLKKIGEAASGFDEDQKSLIPKDQLSLASAYMPSLFSRLQLSQFYGIELDDFAHEVAILSLWLAEHQMNVKFKEAFGHSRPSLPLKEGGKIVCGNATRLDWGKICPHDSKAEIYILGNPPYLGSSMQSSSQKKELSDVCADLKNYKNLDYIGCWFIKGTNYIYKQRAKFAFVSTNSITQGEQVALLWPYIFSKGLEIGFAHQSFKWSNNAKGNAGVTCVIIGIKNSDDEEKLIYTDSAVRQSVKNINPYLISGRSIILPRRSKAISSIPEMVKGNQPTDGGHFILTPSEKDSLIAEYSEAKVFLKKYIGSQEFIKGIERWCLWIPDDLATLAKSIPLIAQRILLVGKVRSESDAPSTKAFTKGNHRFIQIQHHPAKAVIIPSVSSEKRDYIPCGFLDSDSVLNNLAFAVYDAEPYIFGIVSSKIHVVWARTTSGSLETRIRYSSALSYNNFPIPELTQKQKDSITTHALNVLEERERHPEKTIAELYDPKKMPKGLREAHEGLDQAVERCYRAKPFTSDEERLEYLFKLYEEMIQKEDKR